MYDPLQPVQGFTSTGLVPVILGVLSRLEYSTPTPIQEKAIPIALTGGDLLGIAQTGTGKTLAFALPLIDKLIKARGRGLVIVPTRELALQVEDSIRGVTRLLNPSIRTVCLIGGMPMYRQIKDLRDHPRIIIATPGRLQDHIDQKSIDLSDVNTLILDEADRMLDMGFAPQIKRILNTVPSERQTMLFSATMPPEITQLANSYLQNPQRVEVARAGESNLLIKQELCYVDHTSKFELLEKLLSLHTGSALIFVRTKHGAAKLNHKLQHHGFTSAEIHSNRSLGQRKQALNGFKSGQYRILVATDVAARGIDVHNISLVVNFDLVDAPDDHIHRIGRTGRAGNEGLAITFATHDQQKDVKAIERLLGHPLPISQLSETPRPMQTPQYAYRSHRSGPRAMPARRSSSRTPFHKMRRTFND